MEAWKRGQRYFRDRMGLDYCYTPDEQLPSIPHAQNGVPHSQTRVSDRKLLPGTRH